MDKHTIALERLTITYLPVTDITPNDYNPNRMSEHEFGLLLKSITEDGFTQPVVVSTEHTIIDGEHRWRAAQELGMTEVPVVVAPMTAEQARIATLRHNRARGNEDIELAAEVLRDLERLGVLDWAQDSLDITDEELNRLLADISAPEILAAESYGTAWVPDKGSDYTNTKTGSGIQSASPAAAARSEERRTAIDNAKTEEDRMAAQRDRSIYRLVLSFTDEEAVLIRSILGDYPAQSILTLCQEEAARRAGDAKKQKG
jgi:ParB-like nuclease domain